MLLLDLNKSVKPEEQNQALDRACHWLDHEHADLHKAEIECGVDIALVKMLAFLEFRTGFRRPPIQADLRLITHQISKTCQALELLYNKAPAESIEISFDRIGTDLLQILVTLMDDELQRRFKAIEPDKSPTSVLALAPNVSENPRNDETKKHSSDGSAHSMVDDNWERDLMLRKVTKILGHVARVGKATHAIAHFPGLLGSVLNLINLRPYSAIPWEARLSSLWTIANLACNTENMMMMICTPGLINSLVNIGYRQLSRDAPLTETMEILRSQAIASRAFLNLSWPPENKVVMADNLAMVQALCNLAVSRVTPYGRSRTIQDILVQTRRHSLGALRNLAAAPRRSKIQLCNFNNGTLLDMLTDVALIDSDPKSTDLAFATIHNLAIHDTAISMVDKPDLILALKNQLLDEDKEKKMNPENAPKSHAASTILVLERSITRDMTSSYEALQELLYATTPSKTTTPATNHTKSRVQARTTTPSPPPLKDTDSTHSDNAPQVVQV